MKNKATLLNIFSGFLLQAVMIINSFIIPKVILSIFGSNVNGLVLSITKFLSYISLIEGGVSGVIIASLYKPICEKNDEKISSIIKTANLFYRKIAIVFLIYSIILSILYPLIFKSEFNYFYIFSLILIMTISTSIQYIFSLSLRNLLKADKKIFIINFVQVIIIILNLFFVLISSKYFPSIHIIQLFFGVLYIIQPIIYNYIIRKKYNLNSKCSVDNKLLSNRWDGFSINIAGFIHGSADVMILTIFSNLKIVSIYGVYSMVAAGLRQIINSIDSSFNPIIGQSYAKGDVNKLNINLDLYEFINLFLVSFLFTVGGLLVVPFVMIYTKNINDANYYAPIFGYLLLFAEAIYAIRDPHVALAYSANKFKEIKKYCYIEAIINIIVSLLLVKKYNLIGVVLGTICAMIFRLIFQIGYTSKLIKNRNKNKYYKKLVLFCFTSMFSILICVLFFNNIKYDIYNWLQHGIFYSIIVLLNLFLCSLLFFRSELLFLKKYLIGR